MQNLSVVLKNTPQGIPATADFKVVSSSIGEIETDHVLCQVLYLSLDPYMRSQISGLHISGAVQPGGLMQGETIARVISSQSSQFSSGDIVRCYAGWQQYAILPAHKLHKLPSGIANYSAFLSALGTPGLTAYAAIVLKALPKPGDTVVIPAATGGVGSIAVQLAKIYGCRVVGIAGGAEKCRIATEYLGYDICIDRKNDDVATALKKACPDGIDIFLDLVGGELLHTVSAQLAIGARVILCGIMSELNQVERSAGPMPSLWIKARATIFGLVVYDFEAQRQQFEAECTAYLHDGQLKPLEDVAHGIGNAPQAFCRLMYGENQGKVIVKIAD